MDDTEAAVLKPSPGGAWLKSGMLLALIAVAAHLPAARGGFIWDDRENITDNWTLRSVQGLEAIWFRLGATPQYYPLVYTSFWVEYHLWGTTPAGYHLVNMVLHAGCAVVLWLLLRHLKIPGAWFAAAVFAVHPVHAESVAWISERKNVLSGICYLGAMLAYFRYCPIEPGDAGSGPRRRSYVLSLVLFIGAMFSKTVAASLPAAILLLLWWKRGRLRGRDIIPLVPFFVIGVALGLTTAWVEHRFVGATGSEWDRTLLERCLVAGRIVCFYAAKLVWPAQLTFIYPRWEVNAGLAWQYLYPAAVCVAVAVLWALRNRIGRGPLVAVLFFVGTLFPALGFFNVYQMRFSFVADHFQYLASIGLITLFASLLVAGLEAILRMNLRSKPARMEGLAAAQGLILISLGWLTWQQEDIYRSPEKLWRDTIAKNPSAWMAYNNLGRELLQQGRTQEALQQYRTAVQMKPDDAGLENNIGFALMQTGNLREAILHFERAVRLRPGHGVAHNDMAVALLRLGRTNEAIEHFMMAAKLMPHRADVHSNLAGALASEQRFDEAAMHYRKCLELNPAHGTAHYNLARVLAAQGRTEEAIEHYTLAVKQMPQFVGAHLGLATALADRGRFTEAANEFHEVLRIDPFHPEANEGLKTVLKKKDSP